MRPETRPPHIPIGAAVRRVLIIAALAGLGSTTVAACGSGGGGGGGGGTSGTESHQGAAAGLGHVHGLGIDPADGAVYVAAHHGLFKIVDPARLERVARNRQDTMGFAVAGPRTFLASGHPAEDDLDHGTAPHLGLIRSTDAGRTWSTVSHAGRSDFHALQPAGAELYGYDSQTAQVHHSRDGGRTWTAGARMRVLDLGVHADRPQEVYATTPQGLRVSGDGGNVFTPVAGAPTLTHLDALGEGALVGVDPAGTVYARNATGAWRRLGRVPGGRITAFAATGDRTVLAATEDGPIYRSGDGGATFTAAYQGG